ncbi:unnamed protein product [Didymodactylos carnosus]|uniref:Uncharacterized protein n=1 Tax=Didymodactylos carnosus TaxID=1234261 RepID=A0A8S2DQV4_9BILA|nr:unnamed protein product [Didymodactylos carnosus]CAF3727043.1 unnamed protein product [Didymodactylos carnosus]
MFSLVDKQDSTTGDSLNWWTGLILFLVHADYPENYMQEKLIHELEIYYFGNEHHTKLLKEMKQTYTAGQAIHWYTRPNFTLFSILNKAMRQHNIQVAFLFGSYLKDLFLQLKQLHRLYIDKQEEQQQEPILRVYRGQLMSKSELKSLSRASANIMITTNSFLSTSMDRQLSEIFIDTTHHDDDDEHNGILFEIELRSDSDPKSQIFASIKHLSCVEDENEVLFMIGTYFNIKKEDDNVDLNQPYRMIKLTLNDYIDKTKFEILSSNNHGLNLKREISRRFMQASFYNASIEEINLTFINILRLYPNEEWIMAMKYHYLGEHERHKKQIPAALTYFNQGLELCLECINGDKKLDFCLLILAEIY